jgi:hypothetical protein
MPSLPFVDEHAVSVAAGQEETWQAVLDYATALSGARHLLLSVMLGTVPRSGFEVVARRRPDEVVLAGRHRFATYRLVFRVSPEPICAEDPRSRISAETYAAFPGWPGRLYRSALLRTGGHRMATRRMLTAIGRRTRR